MGYLGLVIAAVHYKKNRCKFCYNVAEKSLHRLWNDILSLNLLEKRPWKWDGLSHAKQPCGRGGFLIVQTGKLGFSLLGFPLLLLPYDDPTQSCGLGSDPQPIFLLQQSLGVLVTYDSGPHRIFGLQWIHHWFDGGLEGNDLLTMGSLKKAALSFWASTS